MQPILYSCEKSHGSRSVRRILTGIYHDGDSLSVREPPVVMYAE